MWPTTSASTGKGKGYGKPSNRHTRGQQGLQPPPGLAKVRPLKISKVQQEATELLSTTWTTLTEDIQSKLQAIGIGPSKPEAPELTDVLKTHMEALPQQVQELVTKLTTPAEREIAAKLKRRVTDLKNLSMKKTQLQTRIDQVKTQYAALLTEMQDLQTKLTEGQQSLKTLSDEYMKAVSQTPTPSELPAVSGEGEQIPMAVESFVHSLGISLTEEQKSQLHGLLRDPIRIRKTQRSAGKLMLHRLPQQDMVGNTHHDYFQG